MEKKVNLLGIRKKVILCHTKSLAGITYTVMRPITEEDEQNLDKWECINVDGKRIDKKIFIVMEKLIYLLMMTLNISKSLAYLILIMVELFIVILIIKKVVLLLKE